MIKKVGNWVFGSFFRTMGRFFFFLFFGFMVAMIISKNNISIKWTDLLGIEMVKADTLETAYWFVYYSDSGRTNQLSANASFQSLDITPNGNSITSQYIWFTPLQTKTNKFDYIEIPFMLTGNNYTNTSSTITTNDILTCRRYYCSSYENNGNCARWRCDEWYAASDGSSSTINVPTNINFSFNITLQQDGGANQAPCTVNGDKLKCYLQKDKTYGALVLQYNLTGNNSSTPLKLNFGHVVGRYKDSQISIQEQQQQTNDAITNQTQQQQQQHNETISTITDSNTTEATTEANSFFSNFTSQDNGGISSIITAPLQAISGLVSATCQQIILPIPYLDNKELVLPCMSAIYTEHFGAFFTIYQTIIFGAIAYRMLVSIFMMIQGFKNPDDDKIEVVDL